MYTFLQGCYVMPALELFGRELCFYCYSTNVTKTGDVPYIPPFKSQFKDLMHKANFLYNAYDGRKATSNKIFTTASRDRIRKSHRPTQSIAIPSFLSSKDVHHF